MSDFQLTKLWLAQTFAMSKDALHVSIGLAVFLGVAMLFRLPLRSGRPLLAVLLAAIAGEAWDLYETWKADQTLLWGRSGHDVWMTLLWPTILFLLARWTRVLKR